MKPSNSLFDNSFKVLWVDDDPAQEFDGVTLETTLKALYGKQLAMAKNYSAAAAIVDANPQIRLVLLDMEIRPVATELQGQMIARKLWKLNPELKFIVLSGQGLGGRQMSLGEAGAKLMYIPKEFLSRHKEHLRNLSASWVDDYLNQNWSFTWDLNRGLLHLKNVQSGYDRKISLTGNNALFLDVCLHIPMEKVRRKDLLSHLKWQDKLGTPIEKVMGAVNKVLQDKTVGRIWGLFIKGDMGEIVTIAPKKNITFVDPGKRKNPSIVVRDTIESRVNDCEKKVAALQKSIDKILQILEPKEGR